MYSLTLEEYAHSLTAEAESYCQSRPKNLNCMQQQAWPLAHTACCNLRLHSGLAYLNILSNMQL